MEKIIRIEEGDFKTTEKYGNSYEGYIVVTDKQTIKVGISSGQSCCENYGYMSTNDELNEFEGAELLSIELVDKSLNVSSIQKEGFDEGEAMFVNFNTNKGVMQLVAYNSHNGYYGHNAVLISNEFNHEESL